MTTFEIIEQLDDVGSNDNFRQPHLRHLASELMIEFGISDEADLKHALSQAFDMCIVMDIPINAHFRQVYLCAGNALVTDWLLSDLGSYLLLINGNSRNPNVARARMYTLRVKRNN